MAHIAVCPIDGLSEYNMFQNKLEELRQQFSRLQRLSHDDPRQLKDLLPEVLTGMHRSLEELQAIAAKLPERAPTSANGFARSKETHSKRRHPGSGLRFRTMAERAPALVRVMDAELRCRWANRAWLEFTGRGMKPTLGEGWLEAVHPEDRDRCAGICHDAFDSSRLYRLEYRLQRKDGEYGWVLEIGTPRLTSRGSISGYLGTAIEISEHKQAETHLALQYAVARVLSQATTLEEASTPILQTLCESLEWDVGELWCVDTKERVLRCTQLWASSAVDASALRASMPTRVFAPGAGPVWESGHPIWIADISTDARLMREPEAQKLGLRGMFRLPVSVNGELRAVLRVFCRRVRPRNDALEEFMTAVGTQIAQFTERLRTEETIRTSEARKAAILEASLDAVITIDHQGLVVEFNAAAENIFGYRREDAVGRELLKLIVPPRMREAVLAGIARYQTTGASDLFGKRFDAFALKADGSEFPVDVAIAPLGIGDRPLLTIYVCDATARKCAEHEVKRYQERVRSLMAELLLAEERERRRLAVDLHDGLSQTIALAHLKLSALRTALDAKSAKSLDEIQDLIAQADRSARSISVELSPPALHDLGLGPALQWLVEHIQTRYGIAIELEDEGQPKPIDEKTRIILFRSIREILINAAKHSRARRVRVCLKREEGHVSAAIEDDGVGMVSDVAATKGYGLFSIHERLSHVGGTMSIESMPGKGTRIYLNAPLANNDSTKARVKV